MSTAGTTLAAAGRAASSPGTPRRAGFAPVVAADARLLLLGSFPGEASLAAAQYYAHPRNQFWPLLADLSGVAFPSLPYDERLQALRALRVALWDVHASCERRGSLDSAIRAARDNPLADVLAVAPGIEAVAFNGQQAARHRPIADALGLRTFVLPSSSPAYAALGFAAKCERWRVLRDAGYFAGGRS